MTTVRRLAAHLGWEIRTGALAGTLPGVHRLVFAAHGIATGAYHLRDWEEVPEGFALRLDDFFNLTMARVRSVAFRCHRLAARTNGDVP